MLNEFLQLILTDVSLLLLFLISCQKFLNIREKLTVENREMRLNFCENERIFWKPWRVIFEKFSSIFLKIHIKNENISVAAKVLMSAIGGIFSLPRASRFGFVLQICHKNRAFLIGSDILAFKGNVLAYKTTRKSQSGSTFKDGGNEKKWKYIPWIA